MEKKVSTLITEVFVQDGVLYRRLHLPERIELKIVQKHMDHLLIFPSPARS